MSQTAIKYDLEVKAEGRLELSVPFPAGSRVTVFVIEQGPESFEDLLAASQTTLGFWENPVDDADWNDA